MAQQIQTKLVSVASFKEAWEVLESSPVGIGGIEVVANTATEHHTIPVQRFRWVRRDLGRRTGWCQVSDGFDEPKEISLFDARVCALTSGEGAVSLEFEGDTTSDLYFWWEQLPELVEDDVLDELEEKYAALCH